METVKNNAERISIKLWPPSSSTRSKLVDHMAAQFCSVTFLSKKYGLIGKEEAAEIAKKIEEMSFEAANEHASGDASGDGSSAIQFYAKVASKHMIDALKKGPAAGAETNGITQMATAPDVQVTEGGIFDISKGGRGFITETLAEDLLKPLADPATTYSKIIFSNRSFGVDAARVAERILKKVCHNLTDVDLSDIVAGRPEDEALEVMQIFSSVLQECVLRTLDLSENALGEKGVRAFGALLRSQKDLEELYFKNNGISVEAASAICELIPSVEKLKILHFHNNMTGDGGAIALSQLVSNCNALEDFRCSSTRIASDGGVALAEALGKGNRLTKLDLRDNMFGKKAGKSLSRALACHPGLTEVYLSYLKLKDKGATAIALSLKNGAPNLQILEIAGNEISPKGALALAACVAAKTELRKLVVSENEIEDEATVTLCRALKKCQFLQVLDLSGNGLTAKGAKAAAEAVVDKPDFGLLNIDANRISEEGIQEVKDILRTCTKGPSVLGPLEENDENPEEDEDEEEEDDDDSVDEVESSEDNDELESLLKELSM